MKIDTIIDKLDSLIRFFFYVLIFWIPYSNAAIESSFGFCFFFWMIKRVLLFLKSDKATLNFSSKVYLFFKGFKPICSGINKSIYYFLLISAISVMWSLSPGISLFSLFAKTLEVFLIFFVGIESFREKKQVYVALGVLIFTAFSTAIDSYVQYFITFKDVFNGQGMGLLNERATAGFKTANSLGAYMVVLIPISLSMAFLKGKNFFFRASMVVMAVIMLGSLYITFSRGSWLATFVALLYFALFSVVKRKHIVGGIMLICVVVLFALLTFGIKANKDFGGQRLNRANTVSWRVGVWGDTVEMIKTKPVFGYGINNFANNLQLFRIRHAENPTYAHNCYLQIAAESGVISLLCFLWIVYVLFRRIFNAMNVRCDEHQDLLVLVIGLAAGIFGFLFHSFFDTHFYSLQLSMHLWTMITLEIVICNMLINSKQRANDIV